MGKIIGKLAAKIRERSFREQIRGESDLLEAIEGMAGDEAHISVDPDLVLRRLADPKDKWNLILLISRNRTDPENSIFIGGYHSSNSEGDDEVTVEYPWFADVNVGISDKAAASNLYSIYSPSEISVISATTFAPYGDTANSFGVRDDSVMEGGINMYDIPEEYGGLVGSGVTERESIVERNEEEGEKKKEEEEEEGDDSFINLFTEEDEESHHTHTTAREEVVPDMEEEEAEQEGDNPFGNLWVDVYVGDRKDTGYYPAQQQPPTAPTMRHSPDQPLQQPEEKEEWEDVNDVGFESLWGDKNDDENNNHSTTITYSNSYLTTYNHEEYQENEDEEEDSYHTYLEAPEEKGGEGEWPELDDGGNKSLQCVCRPTTVQQQPLLDLPQHQTLPVVNQLYTLIASLSVCFVVFTYLVYDLM